MIGKSKNLFIINDLRNWRIFRISIKSTCYAELCTNASVQLIFQTGVFCQALIWPDIEFSHVNWLGVRHTVAD